LNETIKTANSIEELDAALSSGETREFFDGRTNRFNIKHGRTNRFNIEHDGELDNQKDRENFEEASSMVNELFECVKVMVHENWIMQREEEERAKQAGFNRPRRNFGSTSKGGSRTNSTERGYKQTELGMNITKECRESRDKIENITRELLRGKIMKEQLTETARQTAYINHLEDAARFQQRIMMTITRQTSGLRTEEAVNESLREHKEFIYLNAARMIQGTLNGQDTNRLYIEVCKLAVCQWKLQMKVLLEMNEEHRQDTSSKRAVLTDDTNGKERAPNHVHPESQKQPQVVMVKPIEPPKQVQAFDQGRIMVPGTCLKCKGEIMGPPHDRGGDSTRTWHKYCKECHSSVRRAGKFMSDTRSIQQVEEVTEDLYEEGHEEGPDGIFGPCEYDGVSTSNETGDPSGKKWKSVSYCMV
jgi:hypothetical protein